MKFWVRSWVWIQNVEKEMNWTRNVTRVHGISYMSKVFSILTFFFCKSIFKSNIKIPKEMWQIRKIIEKEIQKKAFSPTASLTDRHIKEFWKESLCSRDYPWMINVRVAESKHLLSSSAWWRCNLESDKKANEGKKANQT